MLHSIAAFLITVKSLFVPCSFKEAHCPTCDQVKYKLKKEGRIPKVIKESSGLAVCENGLLTHSDSGNPPVIWSFDTPFDKHATPDTLAFLREWPHRDWEEMTMDDQGNIYIGDFGNNGNRRKDLAIIKYNPQTQSTALIRLQFPDQAAYPPLEKREMNFDCEAMFWKYGYLYLISKNRKSQNVRLYSLPDNAGDYSAEITDTLIINRPVTAADISPDGKKVAVLVYGQVLLYQVHYNQKRISHLTPLSCKKISCTAQVEALAFIDEENIFFTNEKGRIYRLHTGNKQVP